MLLISDLLMTCKLTQWSSWLGRSRINCSSAFCHPIKSKADLSLTRQL